MRKSLKRWLIPMSAAMIALLSAGTALAADTVNVKVENARGGYIQAYYRNENNNRMYLPIGQMSKIPQGAELEYDAYALNYYPGGKEEYYGIVDNITLCDVKGNVIDTANNSHQGYNHIRGSISADEDMTIKGNFKGYLKHVYEGGDIYAELGFKDGDYVDGYTGQIDEGKFTGQLYMYDGVDDKVHAVNKNTEITIESISYDVRYEENEYHYNTPDDELFQIDENGKITSAESLKKGEYFIDGKFKYNNEQHDFYLTIQVGSSVNVYLPLAFYKSGPNAEYEIQESYYISGMTVKDPRSTTFNSLLDRAKKREGLVGYELVGLGEEGSGKSFNNIGNKKVIDKITSDNPTAVVYGIFKDYTIPTIEHLTEDDLVPDRVKVGWNLINGEWYYYNADVYTALAKNQWVPCRENDGENVWVGADGKVVSNAVVTDGTDKYLVDAKGHKLCNKTGYTLGNVDYTTDDNGKVTGSKLHLATPSDAAKADQFVDDVMDNISSLTEEEQKKAADMVTESLKTKVDTSKMTEKDTKKYADFYREIYGSNNINVAGDAADENAMIVAAGLTSSDFEEDGSVTIETASNWLATSSNAVKVELALYVNGKTRALTAPVKVEVELPEAFVASYSNASYNFSVSPKPVSYEIKDGKLIITIAKTDVYTVQAAKKSSGSSGSHRGSSGGSGRATVKAEYKVSNGKTGNWIFDNKGWWFKYQDGTWPKSQWIELEWNNVKNWYYFGADGYMTTGWYQDGGKWYYLHPQADGTRGRMYTGWNQIGNNWYYFRVTAGGPKGSLVVNDTTPDGYKVNENGEWVK